MRYPGRRPVLGAAALTLSLASGCAPGSTLVTLEAGDLEIHVTPQGQLGSLRSSETGREYLPAGVPAPLLTLRTGGRDRVPLEARRSPGDSSLILLFGDSLEATVRIRSRPTHVALALTGISAPGAVELAIWGPYPTTIRETIGETVGVVRGEGFAVGIQALNPRTLGGYPWNENDAMPQLDIFESGDYADLSEEGKRHVLYRVEAAKPDSFGSTLQAFARNRGTPRVIPNWGYDRYVAPSFEDGGILGSAIALFGCPEDQALAVLEAIELAEGLPHPTIDGEWGKKARSATAAYLILPFSEGTLDRALDVTRRAGLRYLYHPDPFETWGHFPLSEDFPNGVQGLREAVERARARGVMLGVHTLSNFITTDDAYVTPVPDPRLARVGSAALTEEISAGAPQIRISSPEFFREMENDHLRAAVVGQEIVRYRTVSETPPWTLLDVRRGSFGTRAASHRPGDSIGRLADHAYRVFLTDPHLSVEVAETLASLFNRTGLRQISFDGLEGNRSTGMGNYGEILFTSTWYEALSPEIRRHFIADASRTSHYFWHIYSRMNWGEPWYAGFRESQTEYRLKNQAYFRRNFMPGMLGWFRMGPETSVEDVEWMLARSAAFDAGYAFVTSFEALEENGRSEEILQLLGLWEEARMADVFSPDQKRRMEDIASEFRLERSGRDDWTLTQVHVTRHRIENRGRQPGEPADRTVPFRNSGTAQVLGFILTAGEGTAERIRLEVDRSATLEVAGGLGEGEALVHTGGDRAFVYSAHWKLLREVPVDSGALTVGPGRHELTVDVDFKGSRDAHLKVELRLTGAGEPVPEG